MKHVNKQINTLKTLWFRSYLKLLVGFIQHIFQYILKTIRYDIVKNYTLEMLSCIYQNKYIFFSCQSNFTKNYFCMYK